MENHVKTNHAQLGYVRQHPSLQYFRYTLNRVLSEVKFTHEAFQNLRLHTHNSTEVANLLQTVWALVFLLLVAF